MKLISKEPVTFRVNGQLLAFDAGAPLEVSTGIYKVLSEDQTFKTYLKEGVIKIDQTKPPDPEPPEETPPEKPPAKK